MVVVDLSPIRKNKTLMLSMLIALFLFLALLPWQDTQQIVFVSKNANKLVPIYGVDTPEKKVAISFDATWGAEETPKILATLDKYKVKTTFFLVDLWLDKYPDVAKTIAQKGHEIGMHSSKHPYFTKLSKEEMINELENNHKKIKEITGYNAIVFRPPFGDYDNRVITNVEEMGYKTIQWSIDSLDWKDLSAEQINQRVLTRMRPGAIVLFHNNGKHTAEAIETIIPKLLRDGYKIVPITNLIYKDNYYIDSNGLQRKK